MRCVACNRILNDFEATRRHVETGEFADICNTCSEELELNLIGREDLNPYDDYVEEFDDFTDDFSDED